MKTETVERSLDHAIWDAKCDFEESMLLRRVYKKLGNTTIADFCEKGARKYLQRIRNFKKLKQLIK